MKWVQRICLCVSLLTLGICVQHATAAQTRSAKPKLALGSVDGEQSGCTLSLLVGSVTVLWATDTGSNGPDAGRATMNIDGTRQALNTVSPVTKSVWKWSGNGYTVSFTPTERGEEPSGRLTIGKRTTTKTYKAKVSWYC
jgi:hypothetical protein